MKRTSIDRGEIIDGIVRDIMKILNDKVILHNLTYEEALTITERVRLQIFAKYIDFRLSKMAELTSSIYKKEVMRVEE